MHAALRRPPVYVISMQNRLARNLTPGYTIAHDRRCEENGRVHGCHVVVAVVANFTLAYNLVNALVVYTLHQLP